MATATEKKGDASIKNAKFYCLHYGKKISLKKCLEYFSQHDGVIRELSCIGKKCKSPVKPCIACFNSQISKPAEDAKYFHTHGDGNLCPLHKEKGADADITLIIIGDCIPINEIRGNGKKEARELRKKQKAEEKANKKKEVKKAESITLNPADIIINRATKKRMGRIKKLINQLEAGTYNVRAILSPDGKYRTPKNPLRESDMLIALAEMLGMKEIRVTISKSRKRSG